MNKDPRLTEREQHVVEIFTADKDFSTEDIEHIISEIVRTREDNYEGIRPNTSEEPQAEQPGEDLLFDTYGFMALEIMKSGLEYFWGSFQYSREVYGNGPNMYNHLLREFAETTPIDLLQRGEYGIAGVMYESGFGSWMDLVGVESADDAIVDKLRKKEYYCTSFVHEFERLNNCKVDLVMVGDKGFCARIWDCDNQEELRDSFRKSKYADLAVMATIEYAIDARDFKVPQKQ